MKFTRFVPVLFAVLFVLSGCGPAKPNLDKEKTFAVDFFNNAAFGPDILSVEQIIKVEVTAQKPVDVYILVGINEAAALDLSSSALKEKAVIAKVAVTSETITMRVPADTQGVVLVRNGRNEIVNGKIRLTN